jgi:hypothetical protein
MTYDESLGYDDAMPDAYNSWLGNQDGDTVLNILSKYYPDAEEKLWEHFSEKVYPYLNEPQEE